jgi:hypothetical protein
VRNNAFKVRQDSQKLIAEATLKLEAIRAGYASRGLNRQYPHTETGQLQRVGDLLEASLKERMLLDLDESGFTEYFIQSANDADFFSMDLCKRLYKRKLKAKDTQKRFERMVEDTYAEGITSEEKTILQNIKYWSREVEAFTIYLNSLEEQEVEKPCTQAQDDAAKEVSENV